ncbi:MAG: permease [Candidatus Omnitrophota bacterium]
MKGNNMLIPTIIMGVIAVILLFVGYYKGQGAHIAGLKIGMTMLIQLVPLLLLAFIVAGMVQQLLPHEVISKWIGANSGIRGILIGTIAGGFAPGGPYVSLPLAAALLRSGASVGTMVAFLTGWSLWAIARLPMEVGILGWKLTLIRLASTFFFPPIAGLLANLLFGSK